MEGATPPDTLQIANYSDIWRGGPDIPQIAIYDDVKAKVSYHTMVHKISKLRPRLPSASPRQPQSKHEGLS